MLPHKEFRVPEPRVPEFRVPEFRVPEFRVENGEKTDAVRGLLCYDRTCSDFIVMFYMMIAGDTSVQNERSVHFSVIY